MASHRPDGDEDELDDEEVELQQLVATSGDGIKKPKLQESGDAGDGGAAKKEEGVPFWVVVRVLVYMFTLATMKIWVRYIFKQYHFRYPKFVTTCHMWMSAAFGFSALRIREQYFAMPFPIPTLEEFKYIIGPIAGAVAVSLVLNNSGLMYSSAAYAEVIGATTPLFTIVALLLRGQPYNKWLTIPVLVVLLGTVAGVTGQKKASVLGTVFCFASNIGRAFKGVLQQECLTGESRDKFDPHSLLAWTCVTSAGIMLVWSITSEGFGPCQTLWMSNDVRSLGACLLASSLNAAIFNLMALYMTKDAGAVALLITGSVASVLTVSGSFIFLGESLSNEQLCGFILILGGAFAYGRVARGACDKEEEKQVSQPGSAKAPESTPTVLGTARA